MNPLLIGSLILNFFLIIIWICHEKAIRKLMQEIRELNDKNNDLAEHASRLFTRTDDNVNQIKKFIASNFGGYA